jgi:uncharacterized protein YjiS (DUF1127 family)
MTTQMQPTMNRTIEFPPLAGGQGPLEALVVRAVGHVNTLRAWSERARQRHALSQLDDRLLADIGVSRAAAAHEAAKQPWEA